MPDLSDLHEKPSRTARPRKPERANGRRRYELLLDAAERLLVQDGPEALSIPRLAREAGVPLASVYHFFPTPASVPVGLSERYLAGFSELVGCPITAVDQMPWQVIIATLMDRAVAYYTLHPYAQRLILGSDHSWHIRSSDLANNRMMAQAIADLLAARFPQVERPALLQAAIVGISLADAVLSLSIFDRGAVTPEYGQEATVAICGYLTAKFGAEPVKAR